MADRQRNDEEKKRARDFWQQGGRGKESARTCSDLGAGRYSRRYGLKEEVRGHNSSAVSKSSSISSLIGKRPETLTTADMVWQ